MILLLKRKKMPKIHEDSHGLYIKAGGYIFRPIFPVGYGHVHPGGTVFQAGDTVKANHLGGSSLGSVRKGDIKERWYSHGSYFAPDGSATPSEDCFKPSYENW